MLEIPGKYNTAKVFTDNIDSETISQIMLLMNQEFVKDASVRIMSDTHAGKGCVIGTTMTIKDKIVPNLVGVDIGCGMRAIQLEDSDINLMELDNIINSKVPSGFSIHDHAITTFKPLKDLIAPIDLDYTNRSIGTLGGGNHFIEVNKDKDGHLWLVIHTGSRHLGTEVCKHYQKAAISALRQDYVKNKIDETINKLKAEGKEKDIENTIKVIKMQHQPIPDDLCYVEGKNFDDYIHDMAIAQQYAKLNRETIANIIISEMKFHVKSEFDTIHNYIDIENMILRKGAISAQKNEIVIIPMNMRDGSLICVGKGNPEWNCSAPHGAGRIMSRGQAKERVSMDEFTESMKDIYSTSVLESTIDEAPMVYKPMDEIKRNIIDTVDIIDTIKPIYNFKAH